MNSYQRQLSTSLTVPTILLFIQAIVLLEAGSPPVLRPAFLPAILK